MNFTSSIKNGVDHLKPGPTSLETFKVKWLTLSFPKHIENEYQEHYFRESLQHVRIALALGILIYSLFGILDAWLAPDTKHKFWFIRFSILTPYALAALLFTFTKYFKSYWQLTVTSVVIVAGLCIIAMISIAPYPASHSYYAGLILVLFFGYTFFKLSFFWSTLAGWMIVIAYEFASIWLNPTPVPILINNNFFFLTANILGMFACYSIQYYLRREYIQSRHLAEEKKKVSQVNKELEQRVIERTAQLEQSNLTLKQEIIERKRAEKEQRYLESQLRKSQKMEAIGTLAGGVAHDLNNILSGIVSYPELLLLDLSDDSPLRQPILTIQESGNKAAAIVDDLLALARRGVSKTELVCLNDIIEQYMTSPEYKKMCSYHPSVTIESNLEANLASIIGSPIHLFKVVMNLVSNAVEAIPDRGCVVLSTHCQLAEKPIQAFDTIPRGEYVVLTISDTGCGILSSDVERIFEPFYTKKKMGRSGTGLGMAVVWGSIKDHKGFIDIKSTEGVGTTVSIYFPATHQKCTIKRKSPESYHKFMGRGESILLVDDVKEQRVIASGMLKKLGYQVYVVSSGEEAVSYLREHSADLLVLDMIMEPGINGLETYKKILKIRPEQKAIIASGYSNKTMLREMGFLGAKNQIKKPYSMEALGLAVRSELDRSIAEFKN